MLNHLELKHVGPATEMTIDFAPRLNILTGDNGLGKTFVLDVAWWALTGCWATQPAWPQPGKAREAEISYDFQTLPEAKCHGTSHYDIKYEDWREIGKGPDKHGLALYIRADGGFSVWDPARDRGRGTPLSTYDSEEFPATYDFTAREVWDGLPGPKGIPVCNGLIRDWVSWQDRDDIEFEKLREVLHVLSSIKEENPEPGEENLEPGKHTRVYVNDARDHPTIKLPYGEIPVVFASAGMKRILALAYLIVWAQREHVSASKLLGDAPAENVTILIDEVEAHLHPQWQRMILPALLSTFTGMKHQIIASTHAPLVMASAEPIFQENNDKVLSFDVEENEVRVKEVGWRRRGDATAWLTSEVFGLEYARSRKAEEVMEEAFQIMKSDVIDVVKARQVHEKLSNLLSDIDPFWIRWRYVGEKKGWLHDTGTSEA